MRRLPPLPDVLMMFFFGLGLDREQRRELAHIHRSAARWPEQLESPRERHLRALPSATRADVERLQAELTQERDQLTFSASLAADLAGETERLKQDLEQAREVRAWLWILLKHAVRVYRSEIERCDGEADLYLRQLTECTKEMDAARAELLQRTRERDLARKAITAVSRPLAERTVQLGKANEEIEKLRRELAETNGQLGARGGDVFTLAEENAQLREDLAHARNQQGTPAPAANGETVTLHLGPGKTTTGRLVIDPPSNVGSGIDRIVDHINRALLEAPDGGESRG